MSFKEIRAKNFKSLRDVNFKFNQLNVLVGPNGSGKTNFTELFKLITECIRANAVPSYPFLPWWGYSNVVWKSKEELPISFGFDVEIEKSIFISYDAIISGAGGQFRFIEEKLRLKGMIECSREGNTMKVIHEDEYFAHASKTFDKSVQMFPNQVPMNNVKSQIITGLPTNRSLLNFHMGYGAMYSNDGKYSLVTINPGFGMDKPVTLICPVKEHNPPINTMGQRHIGPFVFLSSSDIFSSNDIITLRQTDYKQIKQPAKLQPMIFNLEEDGQGLQNLLFQWFNMGGIPQRIEYALKELFPNWQLLFEITSDGRILMKVKDGEIYYNPPSLPDGFYRLLTILAAIELRPKILIIDEIESSLHLKIIEYLMDTFRTAESTVLLTTHSPLIVDLAAPENLVILEKENYETHIRKIDDPKDIRKKLSELKISLSESWLYGKL